jgi:hypothetical protein
MNKIKLVEAVQAQLVNQYINMKRKLLRTNAHIWFNRMCQHKNVVPKYAIITINSTSKAIKQTLRQANSIN